MVENMSYIKEYNATLQVKPLYSHQHVLYSYRINMIGEL